MSTRMASKTSLNWVSYLRSSASSFRRSWATDHAMVRSRTKARMISMLTRMARRLRSTLDNIATPCSVNAYGGVLLPPRPFALALCNSKDCVSFPLS